MRLEPIAIAAVILMACHKPAAEEDEPGKGDPKTVVCAPAVAQEVTDQIDIRGTVAPLPDRDAQVSPQVTGRIARVLVREGDHVKVNQAIAQVDTSALVDEVSEAQAGVARARAEAQNAETTLARVRRVFDRGIAARQEVDDAAARSATAKAAEDQAAAGLRRASLHVARGTVRSPMTGVVLKILRRSGELVDGTPATPIMEIGDPSQLELVADVPAQDLIRIVRGAKASVTFVGVSGVSASGTVSAVAPAVDRGTGLAVVRVALAAGDGPAPPVGIYGLAHIATGKPREAVLVPAAALRSTSGTEAEIVVCAAGIAQVKRVGVGVRTASGIEVTGGPQAGDQVAIAPVLGLSDGDKIEPPSGKSDSAKPAKAKGDE